MAGRTKGSSGQQVMHSREEEEEEEEDGERRAERGMPGGVQLLCQSEAERTDCLPAVQRVLLLRSTMYYML